MHRGKKTIKTSVGVAASEARVKNYLAYALAPNTLAAYHSDLRHFRACGGRIPATPDMVARYVADCAGKYKVTTLARRLAAISYAHAALKRPNPIRSEVVRRTMRGILRVHGAAVKQAVPISLELLRALTRPRTDVPPLKDLRDRALLLLGFAGGFRRSELVRLRPADFQLTSEGFLVTVRRSKTDQHAKGRVVAIPILRGRLCPVKPLLQWLRVLYQADPDGVELPLFRNLDRHGNLGLRLSAPAVGLLLKERVVQVGQDATGLSSHSLRAGLVTASAAAGMPVWAIQRQTGHRSEQSVIRYVRGLDAFHQNVFSALIVEPPCSDVLSSARHIRDANCRSHKS